MVMAYVAVAQIGQLPEASPTPRPWSLINMMMMTMVMMMMTMMMMMMMMMTMMMMMMTMMIRAGQIKMRLYCEHIGGSFPSVNMHWRTQDDDAAGSADHDDDDHDGDHAHDHDWV